MSLAVPNYIYRIAVRLQEVDSELGELVEVMSRLTHDERGITCGGGGEAGKQTDFIIYVQRNAEDGSTLPCGEEDRSRSARVLLDIPNVEGFAVGELTVDTAGDNAFEYEEKRILKALHDQFLPKTALDKLIFNLVDAVRRCSERRRVKAEKALRDYVEALQPKADTDFEDLARKFEPLLKWRDILTDAWGDDLRWLLYNFGTGANPDVRLQGDMLALWYEFHSLDADTIDLLVSRYVKETS